MLNGTFFAPKRFDSTTADFERKFKLDKKGSSKILFKLD